MLDVMGFGETPSKDGQDLLPDCNSINTFKVKKVSAGNKLYTCTDIESLTQVAIAIEYGRKNYSVFPCNIDKSPIVDISIGLTRGFKDATSDLKKIAKIWNKYPDAAIGWALPRWIIVLDCDVKKDENKRPVMVEGRPVQIGLTSFQKLVEELNLSHDDLNTLSQDTQSGGRQFIYIMPEGVTSFNITGILPGLDIKGYLGYIILPNSHGIYGQYRFRNLTEIKPIPEKLREWILTFRHQPGQDQESHSQPVEKREIDKTEIVEFVDEILPAWNRATKIGRGRGYGNRLRMAIAGTLYHYGWPESDVKRVFTLLIARSDLKGLKENHTVRSTFERGEKGEEIQGFSTLKSLVEEINNMEDEENE